MDILSEIARTFFIVGAHRRNKRRKLMALYLVGCFACLSVCQERAREDQMKSNEKNDADNLDLDFETEKDTKITGNKYPVKIGGRDFQLSHSNEYHPGKVMPRQSEAQHLQNEDVEIGSKEKPIDYSYITGKIVDDILKEMDQQLSSYALDSTGYYGNCQATYDERIALNRLACDQ